MTDKKRRPWAAYARGRRLSKRVDQLSGLTGSQLYSQLGWPGFGEALRGHASIRPFFTLILTATSRLYIREPLCL